MATTITRATQMLQEPGRPRLRTRRVIDTHALRVGEWSLTAAAWTDRHEHEEINYVLEGELSVTVDGKQTDLAAGDAIAVPAGTRACYSAPGFARMLFVYGPSDDGHQGSDMKYDELAITGMTS